MTDLQVVGWSSNTAAACPLQAAPFRFLLFVYNVVGEGRGGSKIRVDSPGKTIHTIGTIFGYAFLTLPYDGAHYVLP